MKNIVERNIWKPIPGHNGYEINQVGIVRSIDREIEYIDGRIRKFKGKIKNLNKNPNGYLQACISDHHNSINIYPHKMVAELFIEKPVSDKKLIPNHISGDKTDNSYKNLEWTTYSENSKHSYYELNQKRPCSSGIAEPIIAYNENENLYFHSRKETCRQLGISMTQLTRLLESGKRSEKFGYYFKKV